MRQKIPISRSWLWANRHDMSGEAASRSNIDLPGRQLDLVKAIHATGKPTLSF